jgi:hypothetical protein
MLKTQNIQQSWNQECGHKKAKDELQISKKMKSYHQAPCSGWTITSTIGPLPYGACHMIQRPLSPKKCYQHAKIFVAFLKTWYW